MSRPLSKSRSLMESRLRSRSHSRSLPVQIATKPQLQKHENVDIRLVDRKEQDVNICWKYSIICIMIIITSLSIVSTFCFGSLYDYYQDGAQGCFMIPIDQRKVDHPFCLYLYYSPLVIAFGSMFWMQMFYFCGRGGYTSEKSSIDDRPWRIVLPALVFFIIFTILQSIYMASLHRNLKSHCNREKNKHENCEKFYQRNNGYPYYEILMRSSTAIAVLWLLATAIMVLRIMCAPDFETVVHKAPQKKPVPAIVHRISENNNSNERLIYMNREFQHSRSVHFK